MTKTIAAISFLFLLLQATPGQAETCNAGHGCRITCTDGCSAIYNLDTGLCSKACGEDAKAAATAKRKGVNATFRDMPAAEVDRLLKNVK